MTQTRLESHGEHEPAPHDVDDVAGSADHVGHAKRVTVTVQYVGHDDFVETFQANVPVKAIKLAAMRKFGLEPSAADQYVLQFDGADLSDDKHVGELGMTAVKLTLSLKHDVPKGR